jgi:hypothetical protein
MQRIFSLPTHVSLALLVLVVLGTAVRLVDLKLSLMGTSVLPKQWDSGVWKERIGSGDDDCLIYSIGSGMEHYSKWAFDFYSGKRCRTNFAVSRGLYYEGASVGPHWLKVARAMELRRKGTALLYVDSDMRIDVDAVLAMEDPRAIIFPEKDIANHRSRRDAPSYVTMSFLVGRYVAHREFRDFTSKWLQTSADGFEYSQQDQGSVRKVVNLNPIGCTKPTEMASWDIHHCVSNGARPPLVRERCITAMFNVGEPTIGPFLRSDNLSAVS